MDTVPTWTDERVALLRRLWDDGLSASQIAAQIGGISRNAVIGKVHRLGLAGRLKPSGSAAASAADGRRRAEAGSDALMREEPGIAEPPAVVPHRPGTAPSALAATLPADGIALAVSQRVTIMDLRESMCRWPVGDPTSPEFRFCGGRAITGLPYCTQHAQIAYQPANERRRDRRVAGFR